MKGRKKMLSNGYVWKEDRLPPSVMPFSKEGKSVLRLQTHRYDSA